MYLKYTNQFPTFNYSFNYRLIEIHNTNLKNILQRTIKE